MSQQNISLEHGVAADTSVRNLMASMRLDLFVPDGIV
jgi:hypothetical protein